MLDHNDVATARKKMIETYLKCDKIASASDHKKNPDLVVLKTKGGGRKVIDLSVPQSHGKPVDKKKLLASRNGKKEYYETILRANILLGRFPGAELIVSGKRAIKAVEVLLSPASNATKLRNLESMQVLKPGDTSLHKLVTEFRATAQLSERLDAMKRSRADAIVKRKKATKLRSMANSFVGEIAEPGDVSSFVAEDAAEKVTAAPQMEAPLATISGAEDESKSVVLGSSKWTPIIVSCGAVIGVVIAAGMVWRRMRSHGAAQ